MSGIFLDIINASIAASWIVLAVLVLRLLLKKAPKWAALALWSVVAVRLICPAFIESALSLIPSAATFPEGIMQAEVPQIHSGISVANNLINEQLSAATPETSANPLQIALGIAAYVWVIGAALMAIWATVGYVRLRLSVRDSVKLQHGVYECKSIDTPFLLGVFRPRVYLPCGIDGGTREYILAHEMSHRKHLDNIWKPLGYVLLTLHWFNPLMWASYILFCRDIESACDERVIARYSNGQRADYSSALLICSVKRRTVAACPLAFGEVGTKERIKAVLNYKKPAFWIIVIAVIVCIVCAVCFLTNPEDTSEPSNSPTDFSEVEEYQMWGEIDKIDYDLDGDGTDEEWTVGHGPTSGLYSIVVNGKVDGTTKYSAMAVIEHGEVSWIIFGDKLVIQVISHKHGESDTAYSYYSLNVQQGSLYISPFTLDDEILDLITDIFD